MSSQAEAGRRQSMLEILRNRKQSSSTDGSGTPEDAQAADLLNKFEALELAKKKARWASWVDSEFAKMKSAREPFVRQWYTNLAFYLGRQYVQPLNVTGQGFKLVSPRTPSHRVKMVVNKIRPAVRTECAKLTSSRPIPVVTPATNEEEDISAARVGEMLLANQFTTADFESEYRSAIFWSVITGVGYIKDWWDPNADDPLSLTKTGPNLGLEGETLEQADDAPKTQPAKGKISIERVTPFHIFVPDLLAERMEDQPFVIHCMTQTVSWAKKNFPNINATADTRSTDTIMDATNMIAKGREEILDSVLVKEVWIKPNFHEDFPEGGVLTIINGKVAQYVDKWPLPFTTFPFHKIDGLPTGGFYSDSMIVDLIPLQKEYNRTKSQSIEIKNQMGKPKFMYPKGSINIRQVNTEAGQGIPYIAGYEKPEILPGVEVPQSMGIELDRIIQDFDDLSGQHEISRGGTPNSAISSGTAIAFLQEQDDLKLNYQVSSIEKAMERLGTQVLKFISDKWTTERIIRVTGKDNAFESMEWKGSSLRGNHDVKVQTGSALPFSRAAKTAQITEFMQNGWLEPSVGMDMLNMGSFDKALSEMLIDKRHAQRENLKMSKISDEDLATITPPVGEDGQPLVDEQGQPMDQNGAPFNPDLPIPVNSWDNHEAHIQFHNNYRKTQDFELLSDDKKRLFELHVQGHQMAIQGAPMEGEQGPLPSAQPPEAQQMEAEQASAQAGNDPELAAQQAAMEQEQAGIDQEQQLTEAELNNQGTAMQQEREQESHDQALAMKEQQEGLKTAILSEKLNNEIAKGEGEG